MTEEKAKELLQIYLDETASKSETELVEAWYSKLEKHAELADFKKSVLHATMLNNIKSAIEEKHILKKHFLHTKLFKIAAAVFVVVSVSFAIWSLKYQDVDAAVNNIVFTKTGERKKITLTDGSTIVLEPQSKIVYPGKFNAKTREVVLAEGEAFFSIAHEEARPFHVQLPANLNVKVLGTSFRINANKAKNDIQISVSTGKVAISEKTKLLGTLVKGEKLHYNKKNRQSAIGVATKVNTVKIDFEAATLQQVIEKMEYVYNIKIILRNPSLSQLKCTANFNSAQSPSEILDIICSLHHIKFSESKNNKTFKIYQ